MPDFEIVDHTADTGIIAYGKDIRELFINSARGMFSIIISPEQVAEVTRQDINVEAENQDELLVAWLNELLYLFDAENLVFARFEISDIGKTSMTATAFGETIDLNRHEIKSPIKAATYHLLKIEKNDMMKAQVIFDI